MQKSSFIYTDSQSYL